MKFLVTGTSGFLGRIIEDILVRGSNDVVTIGRGLDGNIKADLAHEVPIIDTLYDVVVHAAGKAHLVPKTESEKQSFYDVNVTGTRNLLFGLEKAAGLPKSFVFISTVAVYGQESGKNITEDMPLLAKDSYGRSKIEAEKIVLDWCRRHNVICGILRLPLLAGPNPPGNLGAMIKGIQKGYYFNIAGGLAKKSIVLAEDVGLIINEVSKVGGIYNLTDGYHPSFFELSERIASQLGKSLPYNIPGWVAICMAKFGDFLGKRAPINTSKLKKIKSDLTFNDSKARKELNWLPKEVLKSFKI